MQNLRHQHLDDKRYNHSQISSSFCVPGSPIATEMPSKEQQHHAPIQPLLASQLFSAVRHKTTRTAQTGTLCAAIDEALRGGIGIGKAGLVCVTGDKSSGRTALAFALLSSHLLSSPTAHATLIDTAGTFDVGRLYATILSHLRRQRAKAMLLHQQSLVSDTAVPQQPVPFEVAAQEGEEEAAVKVLDRVRYTRVFDFVGLVDALTEVREGLEARMRSEDGGEASREQIKKVPVRAKEFEHKRGLKRTRSEITHVDDTDEEVDGEEDEDVMSVDAVREQTQSGAEASTEEAQETTSEIQGDGMIVVDCISQLVGPMMKTNIVQTSALLSSFLRSLKQITVSHSLRSILINGIVTWNAPRQMASPAAQCTQPQSRAPTYASSIFSSSSHLVPALSPILAGFVDLHLLLTKQPWSHGDAVALNAAAGATHAGKKANQVGVLEVLSDRYGDRVGRWGPFALDAEGLIMDVDGYGRKVEK
ncbi:hypothetical protein IWZ00DRAFT_10783 [Phyllosticta capitalensis]|uniref:DNA recombination and repair protein Rad51-like C-terminal domain-containing protein n=1 Tax=Phyllosticta capitalensis TaxID=121624 RepID=A0ABR1Z328_9PEZI